MADCKGFVRRVRDKTQTNELEKTIYKICLLIEGGVKATVNAAKQVLEHLALHIH